MTPNTHQHSLLQICPHLHFTLKVIFTTFPHLCRRTVSATDLPENQHGGQNAAEEGSAGVPAARSQSFVRRHRSASLYDSQSHGNRSARTSGSYAGWSQVSNNPTRFPLKRTGTFLTGQENVCCSPHHWGWRREGHQRSRNSEAFYMIHCRAKAAGPSPRTIDCETRKRHLPRKWMGPPKSDLKTPLSSQQYQLPEVWRCTPPACARPWPVKSNLALPQQSPGSRGDAHGGGPSPVSAGNPTLIALSASPREPTLFCHKPFTRI